MHHIAARGGLIVAFNVEHVPYDERVRPFGHVKIGEKFIHLFEFVVHLRIEVCVVFDVLENLHFDYRLVDEKKLVHSVRFVLILTVITLLKVFRSAGDRVVVFGRVEIHRSFPRFVVSYFVTDDVKRARDRAENHTQKYNKPASERIAGKVTERKLFFFFHNLSDKVGPFRNVIASSTRNARIIKRGGEKGAQTHSILYIITYPRVYVN